MLGTQPCPHLALEVPENKHSRDGKARHAPLGHEEYLTVRGEKSPASARKKIRRTRTKEMSHRHNGHVHPDERITELEKRRDKGGKRRKTTRPSEDRALERGGNQTNSRPDAPTKRREIEKAVESERCPIGHGAGGTRPGKMQPDSTKIRALSVPIDIHHPNPQSGLVEVTTWQTNEIARAGGSIVDLIHGPDRDSITSGGKRRLHIVGERSGYQSARPCRSLLYRGDRRSVKE